MLNKCSVTQHTSSASLSLSNLSLSSLSQVPMDYNELLGGSLRFDTSDGSNLRFMTFVSLMRELDAEQSSVLAK